MLLSRRALLYCGLSIPTVCADNPPVAKRIEHTEVRHRATINDPYFWLRDKSNPEVVKFLEAENAYTAALTKDLRPFEERIYKEMLGRIKQTDLSVPVRRGDYLYYSRTEEGKQYAIQCRKKGGADGAEEVLLDGNELARGHAFLGMGAFLVSDDHRMLAYTLDTTGFRQYKLFVKNLATSETLADTAERVTSVEWASDNRTLLFTTEDPLTKRPNQLWRLRLGKPVEGPIYEEKDELFRIHVDRTRDKKYLLLGIRSTDTTETRYAASERPDGEWKVVLPREKKHRYDVDHREGLFYIKTNKNAKNFRIVTAAASDPSPAKWKEFLAHQPSVLVQGIDLFRDFGVVLEKTEAVNRLRVIDFRTNKWKSIVFPDPIYTAAPAENPEYETKLYRYSYQSMVTPPSVYDYDVATGASTLLKRQEVLGGYDPREYASERLWATARDGTRVPISIVYKRGFQRDGKAPLFLYGYGSYGAGMSAAFSSNRLSLLDRGMVYAIAHIRGGNEMGELWHENGMLMKKKNTFYDFIDCAEFLIKNRWTSKERLVIQGGSAGGLLMGAVVNLRPDLFHAVHMAVPFVDVMNTMMDATLPLTVGEYLEWGNPNDKAAYDYMKTYSPYDNLEKRAYPAILVTTSLNDSQVMYWEPAKYVARLRTLKTDSNPLLLKTNMSAGHGGSSGRYDRLRETAFEYVWLLAQVGINE
jgi:oligopeptidase B